MSQNQSLPPDVASLLDGILDGVREFLDAGEAIIPTWFLAVREAGYCHPVPIPFRNENQKALAARAVRELIVMMQAAMPLDCVVFICEGWGVTRRNDEQAKRLMESGNIRDEPDVVDILMIIIETYDGAWYAQPEVFKREDRRELGVIELLGDGYTEGRMTNWLPPKPGKSVC